jgi:hypothetical protein
MGIARAIAGLGGGGLMTMASVVIHDLIPMRSRGKYQSYVNMAQTVSKKKMIQNRSHIKLCAFFFKGWYHGWCPIRRYYQ